MKTLSAKVENAVLDHATRIMGGDDFFVSRHTTYGVFADPLMAGFAMFDVLLSDGTPLWRVEPTPQTEALLQVERATRKREAEDRQARVATMARRYEKTGQAPTSS